MSQSLNKWVVRGWGVCSFVDNKLGWEKKKRYNVGMEVGLLNKGLELRGEWQKNRRSEVLYGVGVGEEGGVCNCRVRMNGG